MPISGSQLRPPYLGRHFRYTSGFVNIAGTHDVQSLRRLDGKRRGVTYTEFILNLWPGLGATPAEAGGWTSRR